MFTEEMLDKYNALPNEKQKDIDDFILTICESERQKQLRVEIDVRRKEVKTGEKITSVEFWKGINEL